MTDNKKQEEQAAEEAVITRESTAAEEASANKGAGKQEAPKSKPKKRRKSSWLSWLLLIVIIGGLSTGWVMMPEKNRQQVIAFVTTHFKQLASSQKIEPEPKAGPRESASPSAADTTPVPASEEAATLPKKIPAELPAAAASTGKPIAAGPAKQTAPTAGPAQIKALTTSIDRLTAELRDMRNEQQQLQQAMLAQQQLQLRSRLNRIADGSSRLPQMAADWQDILLLPVLSETQRAEAESMQQLAAADTANLQTWQKQLEKLAGSLPIPKQADVIPKPQNSWLSWLTGQFHLRPAPTAERQAISALRDRLLDASHALAAESWPDAKSWQTLLKETRGRLGKKANLGLPDNFSALQQDKMKMQALAQNWLEQL